MIRSMWPVATMSVLALLLSPPAPAQEAGYREAIDVDLVNVDVHVVDKKNRPVTGLTRDDFELFVDGKPMPISNFLAVEDGRLTSDVPASAASSAGSTDIEPAVEAVSSPAPLPLHLVVYVDNPNTRPAGRQRALKQLRKFLHSRLRPDDRVMVVNYDLGLSIQQPFTSDVATVEQALTDLLTSPPRGIYLDRRRSQAIGEALAAEDCQRGAAFARTSSAETFARVDASLISLDNLIGSLGGLPSSKALLYVSDGLPLRSGEEVFFELAESPLCVSDPAMRSSLMAIAGEYDHTNALRRLTAHANSNRVTFYPLEAVGIRSFSSSDIEIGPRVMANSGEGWTDSADTATFPSGASASLSAAGPIDSNDDFAFRSNHQGSLFYLADQTGGRAVLNANDLLPDLRRIDSQLRTHYSLGFVPTRVGRGRLHDLQVRLKRPDLKISHRQSFADLDWAERTADQLQALLTLDGHWDNPLAVEVETTGIEAAGKGRYEATLRLALPAAGLLLQPAENDRQTGSLRILLTAQDSAGRLTDLSAIDMPVAFSAAQLQEHPDVKSVHKIQLTVGEGDLDVGLAVLDEAARIASFIHHPVMATAK